MKTRALALGAMVTALSVLLIFLSGSFSTAKAGTLFLLSVLPLSLVEEKQYAVTIASTLATMILAWLLSADKVLTFAYGLFFAWFALLWQLLKKWCGWRRILICTIFFELSWTVFLWVVRSQLWTQMPILLTFLAGQPAYALYVFLFYQVEAYYLRRFRSVIWRK